MSDSTFGGVRLNRFLASCGVASRRGADELILEGRVEINGKIITALATQVRETDHVRLDGKLLRHQAPLTLILHKPCGYICTKSDPKGRDTVYQLLPPSFSKLHYVGRLDRESSGLILFTSSGDLTEHITHPRYQIEKEYRVQLDRPFLPEDAAKLIEGIPIEEGLAKAESVEIDSKRRLRIVLTQGYNRQIRRMMYRIGYEVVRLERIRIGSLTFPRLSVGEYHILSPHEIDLAHTNPSELSKNRKKTKFRPPREDHPRNTPDDSHPL